MPASLNHGLNRFKPEGGLNLPTLLDFSDKSNEMKDTSKFTQNKS